MKKCKKKVCLIGGQALLEGVMMQGATSRAMSVRTSEGIIVTEAKRTKTSKFWKKVPIIRGIIAFLSSLIGGTQCIMKSSQQAFPEEETPSMGASIFATFLGLIIAIALFMLLPSYLSSLIVGWAKWGVLAHSIIEGCIRIILFIGYLLGVAFMPDIRRTFMYHGAEHRTINCFESGAEITVENVQKNSTRHNRCGTTFLFFVMVISILLFSLVSWIVQQIIGYMPNRWMMMGLRLACLPLVAGISYEILRFLALLPDNWFVNIFRAPGLALQKLTTKLPEDDMAEVAILAFKTVLKMDADANYPEREFGEFFTNEVLEDISARFAAKNIDKSDAEWIICAVSDYKRSELSAFNKLTRAQYLKIDALVKARLENKPLDYILGESDFYGIKIKVDENVLIPRPETELLCEQAIMVVGDECKKVLDFMTGSGCIAAVIATKTNAEVTASDISEKALEVAKQNTKDLGVKIVHSDVFEAFEGEKFDLIVSNPPYIATSEIEKLQDEVKAEPIGALDGGEDGLKFYRVIAVKAPEFLTEKGVLLMEIGFDQGESVPKLLSENFTEIEVMKDLEGNDRMVKCRKK